MIRECYARAALNINNPSDRPQFFEAHGTGTQAGDPIEAEAISSAFLSKSCTPSPDPLYVGSIKTIIGHTEGTAGLAGLIKAALAIQNSAIPSNLLFNRLNPRIQPFYTGLNIPTSTIPWPAVPAGTPRRASVNRFVRPFMVVVMIHECANNGYLQLRLRWCKRSRDSRKSPSKANPISQP